jgi:uncharacterized protein (DUF1501 family)
LDDLAAARLHDRVLVMCFSEFGRRAQEKLLDLEDGDLKMKLDFRSVYAGVLDDWLELPSKAALGETFDRLSLFRI